MTGFWKVFAATALVVAAALAVMSALALGRSAAQAEEAARRELAGQTAVLAGLAQPLLARGGTPDELRAALAAPVARAAALAPGRRLTLLAADGTVLADTDEKPADMDSHAERPEVLAARAAAAGGPPPEAVLRWSRTVGRNLLYLALPVTGDDGATLGYARVALAADNLAEERAHLRSALLLSAGLALLLGAGAALLLARSVHGPLRRITDFVGAVARGERAPRVPLAGQGDLAGHTAAVNSMADQLDERFDRIVRDQSEILAVLASMAEGVLAIDKEQHVVLLNTAAASMLSVSASAARGRPVWEVTRIPEVTDLLARCLRTGQLATGEALLAGESHDRVLRLTASPLADEGGPWGCVLVLNDLTEMRRLEQVRRDFVVNVSHELKTPLTAMRGFVEAVIDDPAMDKAIRARFLVRARENTDRMVAIVGDLLSLARIEAEDGALHPDLLDLREVAAACHAEAASAAALREISLQLGLPGEGLPVWGDRAALATAIGNLVDNAIKYTPRGGRVRMHAGAEGAEAFVEVSDNGQGIPSHETDRIFERFYRVDKNRSRELGGTGLGLSIVRHVVLAHGGRVSVQSTVGRGSSFRITLPRHDGDGGPGRAPSGAARPGQPGSGPARTGQSAVVSGPPRAVRSSPPPGMP